MSTVSGVRGYRAEGSFGAEFEKLGKVLRELQQSAWFRDPVNCVNCVVVCAGVRTPVKAE